MSMKMLITCIKVSHMNPAAKNDHKKRDERKCIE